MNNSSPFQQQIRDYLLNRLTPEQEEALEIWLLDTPSAQDDLALEQAMLNGAQNLTDIASDKDQIVALDNSPETQSKTNYVVALAASIFIAITLSLTWPQITQDESYQTVYIEQLRSSNIPKVHLSSQDASNKYQFVVALDDMEPPAFDVTITDVASQKVVFNDIVKPNAQEELVINIKKSALSSNQYRLDIKPLIYQQSVSFILQVSP
ncbi:MAG: hypothetical protein ACPGR2_04815 [Psychrobium sp.]